MTSRKQTTVSALSVCLQISCNHLSHVETSITLQIGSFQIGSFDANQVKKSRDDQ